MTKFATFNNGFPTGFYAPEIHGENIPADAVEITDAQWMEFLENQGHRKWRGGAVVEHEPPGPTPEEQRKLDFPNLEPDQFWFVVRASGFEPDLKAWVAAMQAADPVGWAAASAKLEFAKFFERDHPLVEAAREAIGMSEIDLDALWRYAAS